MAPEFSNPVDILERRSFHVRVRPVIGKQVRFEKAQAGETTFFVASRKHPGVILYGENGEALFRDVKENPHLEVNFGSAEFPVYLPVDVFLDSVQTHETVHLIQIGKTPGLTGLFPDQDQLSERLAAREKQAQEIGDLAVLGETMHRAFQYEYHATRISGSPLPSLAYAIGYSTRRYVEGLNEQYPQGCRAIRLSEIRNVAGLVAWSEWWENLNIAQLRSLQRSLP